MGGLAEIIIIFLMLVLNAVFAAYEMALASVSKSRVEALVHMNRKGAVAAQFMKGRMERSLAVVQLGITLAGAIGAATGGAGVDDFLAPRLQQLFGMSAGWASALAVALFVLPLSALIIIFAELLPKLFALGNKEFVLLALSPLMRSLAMVFYPVVFVFERCVQLLMRQGRKKWSPRADGDEKAGLMELLAAASVARSARMIGPLEEKIVNAAAQMSRRTVRDIMLPAADIAVIPLGASLSDALIRAHMNMHTRFPVAAQEDDPATISGYITFKDIVTALRINPADPSIRGIARPISRMAQDTNLAQALDQLVREKSHIVLATGAEGRITGMITLEDIIEELVGDIEDEYDRQPGFVHPLASGWLMGGGVPMSTVMATVGLTWPGAGGKPPALSVWAEARHGRPFEGGDLLRADGLDVTVRKLRRRKLYEALVARTAAAPGGTP